MKHTGAKIGLAVSLVLAVVASSALAKGTPGVTNTIHNLSTSSPAYYFPAYVSDNVSEVCVFCHTPHGGRTEGPLWNRDLPNQAFTHYSSTTLTQTGGLEDTGRAVNDESRLCLACHDGSLTLDHLINPPNELNGNPVLINSDTDQGIVFVPGVGGGNIGDGSPGNDLSNDHPISFSYDDVWSDPIYQPSGARDGELRRWDTAEGRGVRFFGPEKRVECSSCHDPHVDYILDPDYTPFLITPNRGSNLCLACHDK